MDPNTSSGEPASGNQILLVPPDLDDWDRDEAWTLRRPTVFGDDTCEDLLRAIEKGQHIPLLLDHLAECQAMLPQLHCEILRLADGATYADAVQALRTER